MDTVVRDPIFHDVPRRFDCSVDELFALLDSGAWIDFETGTIDEATYMQRMFARKPPAGMGSRQVRDTIWGGYCFIEGMEALLQELRQGGACVWGLSNYSPWMEELRRRLRLDRFFAGYVLSYKTGFRKPDPRAYTRLLADMGVEPGQCLFVDDRRRNVEAARALKVHAMVFEHVAGLRGELARRGILGSQPPK